MKQNPITAELLFEGGPITVDLVPTDGGGSAELNSLISGASNVQLLVEALGRGRYAVQILSHGKDQEITISPQSALEISNVDTDTLTIVSVGENNGLIIDRSPLEVNQLTAQEVDLAASLQRLTDLGILSGLSFPQSQIPEVEPKPVWKQSRTDELYILLDGLLDRGATSGEIVNALSRKDFLK